MIGNILGIINFSEKSINYQELKRMKEAIPNNAPDINHQIVVNNMGMAILGNSISIEDEFEELPRKVINENVFNFTGRLDNREELIRYFKLEQSAHQEIITDSYLAELAYRTWKEDCTKKLLGDWALAVWNINSQELFIARDHFGYSPIFYSLLNNTFVFSSHRKALFAAGVPRRLNELYLGQVLVSWSNYHNEKTIDLDVFRLPPAHAMKVSKNGIKTWCYWKLEEAATLQFSSFDECVEGFHETLNKAVEARLRTSTSVVSTLSGGLDSSTVTLTAADILQKNAKSIKVYTSAPLYPTQGLISDRHSGDETSFARLCANQFDNINHQILRTPHISPLEGVTRCLDIQGVPGHSGANMFWLLDILEQTQNSGANVLLTGQTGNATLSWTGTPNERLLKENIKLLIKKIRTPLRLALGEQQYNWEHTAINNQFAEALRIGKKRELAVTKENFYSQNSGRLKYFKPQKSIIGDVWHAFSTAFGIEVRDPAMDVRLMMYSFSVPNHFFTDGKNHKLLLKHAMKNIIPDEVLFAKKKGLQAADLTMRTVDIQDEVLGTLQVLKTGIASKYLDIDRMEKTLLNAIKHKSPLNNHRLFTILYRGIDVGLFLHKNHF